MSKTLEQPAAIPSRPGPAALSPAVRPQRAKFEIYGEEMIEKQVKQSATPAGSTCPRSGWARTSRSSACTEPRPGLAPGPAAGLCLPHAPAARRAGREAAVSCHAARERHLTAAGWVRQFTADEPRLSEAMAAYRELGFEVIAEPLDPAACAQSTDCAACFQDPLTAARFRVIFTRRPADPSRPSRSAASSEPSA
ncbi:MAG: hypothetical protein V1797_07000 [Pseudomonadota bacterium]